jgi:polar amino acid transport system ATP-binding protein
MNKASPSISVSDLHKSFHGTEVLRGVDLEVRPHELTVVLGPSGCGKSTLLRCLNGLELLDRGKIQIAGLTLEPGPRAVLEHQAAQVRSRVGMVFQSFHLFPHLTVLENLSLAPRVVGKKGREESEALSFSLLAKVGLSRHARHHPHQLSGGQQQRAAIARSLAMSPQVLLLDEPTSALDPSLAFEVLAVMKDLHAEGMTQVLITHDLRFARKFADRVAFMVQGKIVEHSSAKTFFSRPRHPQARAFLKHGQ